MKSILYTLLICVTLCAAENKAIREESRDVDERVEGGGGAAGFPPELKHFYEESNYLLAGREIRSHGAGFPDGVLLYSINRANGKIVGSTKLESIRGSIQYLGVAPDFFWVTSHCGATDIYGIQRTSEGGVVGAKLLDSLASNTMRTSSKDYFTNGDRVYAVEYDNQGNASGIRKFGDSLAGTGWEPVQFIGDEFVRSTRCTPEQTYTRYRVVRDENGTPASVIQVSSRTIGRKSNACEK